MISVVVRVDRNAEALAATLRALVPGVVEGLVGDAVVLAATRDEAVATLAEAVGATFVLDEDRSWTVGAQAARREWILCLAAGDVLAEGWIPALDRFVALSPSDCGIGRLQRRTSWRARLQALAPSRKVRAGDLVRRDLLLGSHRGRGRVARIAAAIRRDPSAG